MAKKEKDAIALYLLKKQAEEIGAQVSALQTRLVETLVKEGIKTFVVEYEGNNIQATFVQGTTTSIDEVGLEKTLGTKLWAKVVKQVLDKKKLEALIVTKEIDVKVVAKHSETKNNAPYIKLTPQ